MAAAAVAAASCGSSDATEDRRVAACDVLTRRDVGAVLEAEVAPPTASARNATDALAGRSGCAWSTSDGTKAVLVELVRTADMAAQVRRTGFSAAARFDAAQNEHPDAEEPEGPWQRGLYVEESATFHVLAHRSYLTFEVAVTPPSLARPIALELATRSVRRLEQTDEAD